MDGCSEVNEYASSRIRKQQMSDQEKYKMFIKNEAKITSKVNCVKWAGVNFSQ